MLKRLKAHIRTRDIVLFVLLFSIFLAIYGKATLKEYARSLSTEMVGAVVIYFIFENILSSRQEKEKYIRQLRSKDHGLASQALDELWDSGAVRDGSLCEAYLVGANLEEADFEMANLKRVNLSKANLKKASFLGANLEESEFQNADLEGSVLSGAKLKGAILIEANLFRAELYDVDLRGADLRGANLKYAEIDPARIQMDEDTVLPNGEYWTPDINITNFTKPSPSVIQSRAKGLWRSDRI